MVGLITLPRTETYDVPARLRRNVYRREDRDLAFLIIPILAIGPPPPTLSFNGRAGLSWHRSFKEAAEVVRLAWEEPDA